MAKRIRNRRFLFEQQLKSEFWNWSIKEKRLFDDWEANKDEIFRNIFDHIRSP